MEKATGGDVLCRSLKALNADTIYGLPGSQTVPLFDCFRRSKFNTVLATSELNAGFMANGYFRASGRPGILATIPGPGFTHALSALGEAHHDSVALVMMIVTPERVPERRFQLQDIDHHAIAGPLVKESLTVHTADALPAAIGKAFSAALEEGPGPVLVELASSIFSEEGVADTSGSIQRPSPLMPDPQLVEKARTTLFNSGERVLLLLGQGAADYPGAVGAVANSLNACVIATSSGRGVLPETEPRVVCRDYSVSGIDEVNRLVDQSDVVLALGCKLTHNGTSGFRLRLPEEKLIRVDSSVETLGGNYPAFLSIRSDVGKFLQALGAPGERNGGWTLDELKEWKARFDAIRSGHISPFPDLANLGQNGMRDFFRGLRSCLPDHSIVVTDSGLHQMATRLWLEVRSPRGLIFPSDFQSMGFGIPAAIGAALAAPERKVVAIVGDGGFAMSGMELSTAVREGINLTVIVFNDGHLGQIRLQQLQEYGKPHATELGPIRFRSIAEGLGASYLAMDGTNLHQLREALEQPGVTLVDLLLTDSAAAAKLRAMGLIKAGVRKTLGRSGVGILKRFLGRGPR